MKLTTLSLVVLFLFLSGCNKPPTNNNQNDFIDVSQITMENYPRVDGSTSTHPLQIVIACNLLGAEYQWFVWLDGTRRVFPDFSDSTKKEINDYIVGIRHSGTHGSYVNLITDSADVIIVARQPSEDELTMADSLGITIQTVAVAIDAFVFILNVDNPVNNLSVEQIQGIYTGNITNWNELGGSDATINAYQRNKNSGSQELMEELVMKELQMIESELLILYGMMGPINKLVADPYGIGYTVYFFNQFMAPRDKIKLCNINGIKPEYISISTGNYEFTTLVYVAIRSDLETSSTAFTLWRWLQSQGGQQIISESGYIPIK